MRVHVLQHVPFEGLGSIESWLQAQRAAVSYTRFFAADGLPDPASADVVIVLGGPMSVNDARERPWLVDEKRFLRDAISAGKTVLGMCLGAQLIASALGARVYRNADKEIGWWDVEAVAAPVEAFAFPQSMRVFHWHGETFDLPPGARHLARSRGCAHQAFQIGTNVIGLQFHLETTQASAEAMIANCRQELVPGRFIQTEAALHDVPASAYHAINAHMVEVLDYLTRRIGRV